MSTSDTTVPTAQYAGFYHCTGTRPEHVQYFDEGQPLKHGPDCGEKSVWLFSVKHNAHPEDLIEVSIDLDTFPRGVYIQIDGAFPGDIINLRIEMDYELADLADGAYRIIGSKAEDANLHFWAEKIGHNHWEPEAPLYHASPHPR